MDTALEALIWRRARRRCEYCRLPQGCSHLPFQIDHIIALQHRGLTIAANLALACMACNNHKGPNIAGLDPITGKLAALFHPRRQKWERHFRWQGPELVGRTPIGRTTIAVLAINLPHRIALREELMIEGVFFGRR